MENRFGFKEFVICVLLLGILVSVWLAMKQFDRQWDEIRALRGDVSNLATTQNELKSQLGDIRRAVSQGVVLQTQPSGDPAAATTQVADSFHGLRAARANPDFAEGDMFVSAFGVKVASLTALTYKDLYGRRVQEHVLESLAAQDDDTLEFLPHIAESWVVTDNSKAWDEYMAAKKPELEAKAAADASVFAGQLKEITGALAAAGKPAPAAGSAELQAMEQQAREAWINEEIKLDPARPSAMTITFKLRRGVNFSDGHPLTAHDVEFTWQLLNNPKLDAPESRNFYDNVEGYKALDDYTVEFRFREPHYMAFTMAAGFTILPKHFYEKISIEDINSKPGLLLGSGPYRLETPTDWGPGKPVKLIRNENYWGPKPGADGLLWLEIEQDIPRLTAFKNGDIDIFSPTPEQYVDLKKDPKILEQYDPYEYMAVPSGYSFIAWNCERGGKPTIFADKRVRQAMTHLIDRERIVREVMLNLAVVASGPFDAGSKQSDLSIKPRPTDRAKALALLAECGWKAGADGVVRNVAGEPFAFTLTYASGNELTERIMLMIKDEFNSAGVLMTQDPQEWSVFIQRVDGHVFDACTLGWGGGAIESDIRQMFHTSQIASGANNFTSYRNSELDKMIDQARRTIDETERMKLWQTCHRILHEDQPYTFMYRRKDLAFLDKRMHGVKRVLTGLNGRTEWYVPAAEQKRTP